MRRTALALLVLVVVAAGVAGAAAPAPTLAALEWQRAPLYGGDVRALAFDPRATGVVLASTSAGQVYRSDDGGESWRDAGAEVPFPGWVVVALAFDPNRPGRVWAGMWGLWGGGMIACSDDLGAHWTVPHPPFPDHQIYALAFAPAAEPGGLGRLYAATRAGVLGSDDDGHSYRLLTASQPELVNVASLYVDPRNPRTILAGTWRRAYRSDDGGESWRAVFDGMVEDTDVFSLNPVAARPDELWASTCGWVYRSIDLGQHWTRFKEGLAERRTPSFRALPDGTLLAGTVAGVYRSIDSGQSWARTSAASLSILTMAEDPGRPQRVLVGTEGAGVYVSEDSGQSFRPASRGMQNLRIMALAKSGPEILAAVNHAGPGSGVYSSFDRGRSFAVVPSTLPTVLDLAAGDRLWAATEQGLFERRDGSWQRLPQLGTRRIEQVIEEGRRVVVRTGAGLLEWDRRPGGKFAPLAYRHGAPRSAALADGALWVSDGKGLYRLTAKSNHEVSAPFADGSVVAFGGGVLLAGGGGAFARASLEAPWREIAGGAWRALPTGSPDHPVLLVNDDSAVLLGRDPGAALRFAAPVPARDVAAALVDGDRLFLGTAGYGLLVTALPPADAAPATAGVDR